MPHTTLIDPPNVFGLPVGPCDATCQANGSVNYEPPKARAVFNSNSAHMASTPSLPKLMLLSDGPEGGFGSFKLIIHEGQAIFVQNEYGMDVANIGRAGHFGPEDASFNMGRRIIEWAQANNLLP